MGNGLLDCSNASIGPGSVLNDPTSRIINFLQTKARDRTWRISALGVFDTDPSRHIYDPRAWLHVIRLLLFRFWSWFNRSSFGGKIVLRKQFIARFVVFTHFVMLLTKQIILRNVLAWDTRFISSHVYTLFSTA